VNPPESAITDSRRNLSTGPLVWTATISCTVLMLALLKQALWLVVPFLLAIILYYALFPLVRRLSVAGVSREAAAAVVAGGFSIAAVVVMIPTVSWIAANAVSGEKAFYRYFEAGQGLIARTLVVLESQFAFLARMGLHEAMARKTAEFSGTHIQEQLTSALLAGAAWLPSLMLAPFFAFFFLRDGRRFINFLGSAVPNAYFERTLYMLEQVDSTARAYFQGLLKLTLIDTLCLSLGLAILGIPGAFVLGLTAAVCAWVPIVGAFIGGITVALVTATDFPNDPGMVYAAIGLFVFIRLLDDFVFIPLTLGRSLRMHPLPTVLLIFVGGAVAGIPGLIMALPLAGVVMVVAGTIGGIIIDPRLRARHAFAQSLRSQRVTADLQR
jgi:predicted PurR-regulated permease PerM